MTGRHPPPPIETPTEYAHARIQRPGPARARPGRARLAHPAAVAGQQTAPRQLPAPAAPGTASPPTSRTHAPAWPRAAGATASAPPPPTPAASPPGGAASPARCPASPRAPPAWSWSTSTPTAARSRPHLATGLLPGIDLAAEPIPRDAWDDPGRFRDGRDTLTLLARLRGGAHPWPGGPEHQPVTAATPSGGVHLWYQAPAPNLRQALADPHGRYGLAWQIDLKAGWSYGIAPGATTTAGTYQIRGGDPTRPGRMPGWFAREVIRATTTAPRQPATPPPLPSPGGPGPAAYLATVIDRGAVQLAALTDGRKRALSALAYHAGGLLHWSGLPREHVTGQLIDAGTTAGLAPRDATRIVHRAITNGIDRPVAQPGSRP